MAQPEFPHKPDQPNRDLDNWPIDNPPIYNTQAGRKVTDADRGIEGTLTMDD